MIHIIICLQLFLASPLSAASSAQKSPAIEWLRKAVEPEVVIPIVVTLFGTFVVFTQRAMRVEAKLGRENFKKTLLKELSAVISDQMTDLRSEIGLKIEKISIQVEYIARQSEENDVGIKSLEVEIKEIKGLKTENYKELKSEIGALGVKTVEVMAAIQSSYRYDSEFLARIDAELSSVLSAYLKCPVEIKLFRTRKED